MDDFHIVVVLYAKEGRESELHAALVAVVEPSRRDHGNLGYELFSDQDDPRRFVFVEHWENAEAQEKHHTKSPHILDFNRSGSDAVERVEFFYKLDRVV
ncbi:putative quinol monooxygenase [Paraburkholderia sp. J63]|uniref:putative quinol monooxygenase n=1 Tax=Paraburkholderia sp. J63 TaxID=2805434 RepID=UPI002ABE1C57|nr:putative quinol monooxygenase [Paraburkholderia sp. J63]